jgi:hypothetical protein
MTAINTITITIKIQDILIGSVRHEMASDVAYVSGTGDYAHAHNGVAEHCSCLRYIESLQVSADYPTGRLSMCLGRQESRGHQKSEIF